MAYCVEFRKQVLDYYQSGYTQKETAEHFGIGETTVSQWYLIWLTTGSVEPKELNRSHKKIDPDLLRAYIQEHSDAYLSEIAQVFNCSDTAVSNALRRHKITRKKRPAGIRNKTL
jgi:transposase